MSSPATPALTFSPHSTDNSVHSDSADEADDELGKGNGNLTPKGSFEPSKERWEGEETLRIGHERLERAVDRVESVFDHLYFLCKPYTDKLLALAEHRPLFFTFASLWLLFSAIPLAVFLGFVAFCTVSVLLTSAAVICATVFGILVVASSSVVGSIILASAILLPVLFVTTLFSLGSLSFLLGLFLVHRLYLHLSAATTEQVSTGNLAEGVRGWVGELGERATDVIGMTPEQVPEKLQSLIPGQARTGQQDEKEGSRRQIASPIYVDAARDEKAALAREFGVRTPAQLSEKTGYGNNVYSGLPSVPS